MFLVRGYLMLRSLVLWQKEEKEGGTDRARDPHSLYSSKGGYMTGLHDYRDDLGSEPSAVNPNAQPKGIGFRVYGSKV